MNINYELYRVFFVVATLGNITRASQELMISQPAISKSIKSLEEQLGGQLFVRTKRGVVLTNEGIEFYNYIKKAIEYINSAENRFTDLVNLDIGTIRIGVSTTVVKNFLLKYLERFHELYPNINIQIMTNVSSELINKLKNGLLDLIVLNLPYDCSDDINIQIIKKIQDCFVASDKYLNLIDKKLSLSDLNNYPLILQTKGSSARGFIDNFTNKHNVFLKPNMELASYSLVVEFTKIGFGIGYVTKEYVQDDLRNKKLYELDIDPKIPNRYIGIATHNKNLPSFSTKKLIQIILENEKDIKL